MGRRLQRRRYQQRVGSLLAAIDERHRRQLALAARGVTPMGMRGLELELRELRDELAAAVAAGSDAFAKELRTSRSAQSRRPERASRAMSLRPAGPVHSAAHS